MQDYLPAIDGRSHQSLGPSEKCFLTLLLVSPWEREKKKIEPELLGSAVMSLMRASLAGCRRSWFAFGPVGRPTCLPLIEVHGVCIWEMNSWLLARLKRIHDFALCWSIASRAASQGILKGLPAGLVCFASRVMLGIGAQQQRGWQLYHSDCSSLINTPLTCVTSWVLRRVAIL